jgi:antitoxin component YwqK of YwqJK toxin-antitoxin module
MKIKEILLLLVLPIVALSCTGDTEMHKVLDDNGQLIEEYSRRTKDHAKQGPYTRYYQGMDKVYKQAHYENDTLHGMEIIFYETGDTQEVAQLVHGVYHGEMRAYHPNGKLSSVQTYVNDRTKGVMKTYYNTGELFGEYTFDGVGIKENGPFVEYHVNGKKAVEGTYLNGKENGVLKEYDEAGELTREADCGERGCVTTWSKEPIEGQDGK